MDCCTVMLYMTGDVLTFKYINKMIISKRSSDLLQHLAKGKREFEACIKKYITLKLCI